MSLNYSIFVPHPPILISEIGHGEEQKCPKTLVAYREIARHFVEQKIHTVIIISPHAPLQEEGITLYAGSEAKGDFARFGAPNVQLSFKTNNELAESIMKNIPTVFRYEGCLDHGALVPLYFLAAAGWQGQIVLLGMPLHHSEEYGQRLGKLIDQFPQRCALIASGDLSHRLHEEGPYGFDPAGPEFDRLIVECLGRDPAGIRQIPAQLADEAGECGYRSLRTALAAKKGAPKIFSYEAPFGVGYLIAELYTSSAVAAWARKCLEHHLGHLKKELVLPQQKEFQLQRACFVSLKSKGELRGCIGTTHPYQENLAREIEQNAIAAATQDPRFWPVEYGELPELSITVDVLSEMERIHGLEELDPWRYGLMVRGQGRSGLLLPMLEGVDSVSRQVAIARQKAGISPQDPIELWRFEVVRHYE